MSKMKMLFNEYKSHKEWDDVEKTHENLFRMGVQAISLRMDKLVEQFFNERNKNEWQLLHDEQQEQFIKAFSEWMALEIFNWR